MNTSTATSHYPAAGASEGVEARTLCVLVDNEPGVLARVVGLFSGRGYNIEFADCFRDRASEASVPYHYRHARHAHGARADRESA